MELAFYEMYFYALSVHGVQWDYCACLEKLNSFP